MILTRQVANTITTRGFNTGNNRQFVATSTHQMGTVGMAQIARILPNRQTGPAQELPRDDEPTGAVGMGSDGPVRPRVTKQSRHIPVRQILPERFPSAMGSQRLNDNEQWIGMHAG